MRQLENISLVEAEEYFKQIKQNGISHLNFNLSWELIEQEGPEIYNEEYLAKIRKVLLSAQNEGISVCINFCYIEPVWTRDLQIDKIKNYTAAFNHAQRRLKNCSAITGWHQQMPTSE
ncbi:MAG: cellulase family glycosylhydrolase [Treponema sp.]|nr:cellulase family glycosylhydrolase [Treponema sp.]